MLPIACQADVLQIWHHVSTAGTISLDNLTSKTYVFDGAHEQKIAVQNQWRLHAAQVAVVQGPHLCREHANNGEDLLAAPQIHTGDEHLGDWRLQWELRHLTPQPSQQALLI